MTQTTMHNVHLHYDQIPIGVFHGGEQLDQIPAGTFHGGEQLDQIPAGTFHA